MSAERFKAEHDHPSRYQPGPYEAIKVIEAWNAGFCVGNALKYICRHQHKGDPIGDLRKALWYAERAAEGGRSTVARHYCGTYAELIESPMCAVEVVEAWGLGGTSAARAVIAFGVAELRVAASELQNAVAVLEAE